MSRPILEVIATRAEDAVAAVAGGADRLEVVTDMSADGLTPDVDGPDGFGRIRDAVDVPLRVMLRQRDGFLAGGAEGVDALRAAARRLRAAGAEEFVLGFLDRDGRVDAESVRAVLEEIPGCAWTFHRALDHAADREEARAAVGELPGVDGVLTGGSAEGVAGGGLSVLVDEARAGAKPRSIAGGGLTLDAVPRLAAAGVDAFHVGRAVRPSGWSGPVSATEVHAWREALDAGAAR
ncbi:copper homeostasis protein CutC [Phaeacidiphilus oryzae]|uniref:copper homeostasis protein CutC n=1 Tax=Phaeacidiphilus oryzae TaxID=348818 RepID=UPI000562E77A|nr:copper homeostasis protein CutC [Phaeacidiphilus oryzae]